MDPNATLREIRAIVDGVNAAVQTAKLQQAADAEQKANQQQQQAETGGEATA